jgi:integrase
VDFTFHDLRHTFASCMVMSGASLRTVADQLGHRDIRMVMRYAHLSASHRANAMSQLDNVFGSLVCHPGVTATLPPTTALTVSSSI